MLMSQSTNDIAVAEVLERLNKYISDLARRKIPRYAIRSEELDLEIDELIQQTRIKLWHALQKGHIVNPTGYARSIVFTEAVNMQRRYKPTHALSNEEDGELYHDKGTQDPSLKIEQDEALATCVTIAIQAIQTLPPRQRQAMICSMKDRYDDALPLLTALKEQGIDIENICWPDEKVDVHRLKALLSVSRKKLRYLLK